MGTQKLLPQLKEEKLEHPKKAPLMRVKGKHLQPPSQLTLFDTKQFESKIEMEAPNFWGHQPEPIDSTSIFRLFFNNPNGLKLTSDPTSVQYSFSLLSNLGVGAVGLAETNLNWEHPSNKAKLRNSIKKEWHHSTFITSHLKEDITGEIQPGGTLTFITNNWTSRVIDRGTDPYGLGRWTYITLRGQQGTKVTIVTAYRVCPQTLASIGPNTSTAQQYRTLSKEFRESDLVSDPKPRLQFIVDLQAWLEYKIQDQHSIILVLDANEGIQGTKGSYYPLEFTLGKPISTKGHDGSLATLIHTCGLCDPLCIQHTEYPPPPTYSRGKDRIDYILVSTGLLPSVLRTGIFPYDHIFITDHRPCYIDFDSKILFHDGTPSIATHIYRGLQTIDPRLTKAYEDLVNKQIQYHNIESRIQKLQEVESIHWNESHTKEYESIDQLLTEAMCSAEKSIAKKVTTTYAWSPVLKQAVSNLRYWQLSLKKAKGRAIPDSTLIRYQNEAELDPKNIPNPLKITDIVTRLRQARKDLHDYQKKHLELRTTHLLNLAEARLIARKPSILDPNNIHKLEKQRQVELKRIIRKESIRETHRKIGYLLNPNKFTSGLGSIDIPAGSNQPYPTGPDPKLWQGAWQTVTNPQDLADHIAAANAHQYHQADTTPFGQEPLKTFFGYKGDQPGAESLIQGHLPPPEIMTQLLPETQALLKYLSRTAQNSLTTSSQNAPTAGNTSPLITPEQFKALYKIIDERTSSSPSGRHVGHYKVAAHSALLSTIHSSMMSIPYKIGFSPRRWQQIIDVMLEKKPGDRRIHRLRIVALQESDFNQSNRLLLGRPLLHKLEDQHDIPDMQNGSRPSKMCHSAVLNKVLTYEIHRYQKKSLAYIENDAVGCYDRIVNPLIIIFLRILGLSPTLLSSLAATWESTYHRVKTLYGVSKVCYANDPLRLLYGPGQGSTIGPLLWLLCFILIFRSLSPSAPGITITSVDHQLSCQFKGEAFVDDAGLGVNLHSTDSSGEIELTVDEEHVLLTQQLQRLAQEWEKLLYSTGGALNLQKCFWFLLSWRWVGGKAKLHTQLTLPASLTMTAGLDNTPTTIPRIEPTQSFRTLGVYLTPSGCNKGAQTVLQDIVLQYATHITGSRINRQHALVSYIQYLLPKLRYQPPLLSLPQCALDKLQSTTLKAVLPKLNLNRNTARSIIHGPEEYGGLSLPHITHLQGIERLYLFLGHLRLQDRTAQLLQSDMSFLQLLTGSGSLCMNQPIRDYQWIETGWLTSLWDYVNTVQIQFIYPNHWLPNLPRQGDAFIMEQFIKMKLPNSIMERLNRCRLYLQALTISDLVSADGIRFLPSVKKGIPLEERRSSLLWPHQGPPTKADWQIWSNALSHLETNGQLTQPLGAWQATSHQQWSYFIHLPTQMVYHQPQGFAPRQYQPIINPNARTRSQLRPWYDFHHSVPAAALPHPLHPVTIDHNHVLTGSMFQINASTTPLVALPSSPKTNFLNLGKYLEGQPPPILQIQEAMADRNLTVVCSSNYDRDANLTTSTCSFQSQTILYEYESLPMTIPRYRAELFSVLISLYIIHQAEPSLPVTENTGSINLLSNSKKLVRQAFDRSPLGIRTAIRPHYDLILEIRHYRSSIQTPIVATYCPVHNGGVQPLQPLASDFVYICKESPYQYTIQTPLQSHVITAVYRGEPLLGNIQQTIVNENYKLPLQLKLQKDNGWTSEQFSLIDWLAYQRAFQKQPRSHRISIAKLSHQLWNTNSQNHKYYGQNDLCPYCKQSSETMTHIFTCTHPEATTNRASALDTLRQSLAPITPSNLLDTLISGLTQWTADPTLPTPLAPTEGSILPQLASLTTAFRQQSSLSWLALIRGHLAKGWATAYCANYVPRKNKPVQQETITQLSRQWCHKLIPMMWQYGKTIWSHRNAVVHGKTTLSPSKDLLQMQEKIRLHYHNFHCNNHYVPHAQAYLFQRDIQRTLQLRRDTMACWLHSVQEAILTQAHRQEKGNKKITSYFLPRPPPRRLALQRKPQRHLWQPPFSTQYYAKHEQSKVHSRTRTRAYKHPAYRRCTDEREKSLPTSDSLAPTLTARVRLLKPASTALAVASRDTGHIHRRPCNGIRKHRTRVPLTSSGRLTLHHFGFSACPPTQQNNKISLSRHQADRQAQRTEYSGTYVSTAP